MNACFLRVMIVVALAAAHLSGLMTYGHAGAVAVKAPPCGMACCVKGVCECQTVPADTPQSAPNAPVANKLAMKYVPMLLAILPAPAAISTTMPALPTAIAGRRQTAAMPIFRLHCAMLM